MFVSMFLLLLGLANAQEAPAEPASPTVSDANRERAVSLFNNGRMLFDEGNYTAAVAAWEKAYELTEEPDLLFNIASAYERAGDYDKALDALNLYRALGDIKDPETLQRRMRNLEAQRNRTVTDAPTPSPEGPVAPEAPSGSGSRVAGVVLVGVGTASLATGGVLAGLAGSRSGRARNSCLNSLCLDTARSDIESARQLGLGADIALVTGAVALGTGVVVLATRKKARSASVGIGLGQATVSATF